jgi:hypothetical protein
MPEVVTLSPETAYTTKPNIVWPSTAVSGNEAEKRAAVRLADEATNSTDGVAANVLTRTHIIKRGN